VKNQFEENRSASHLGSDLTLSTNAMEPITRFFDFAKKNQIESRRKSF